MKSYQTQSQPVAIKKCDECGKAFNLNDGNVHYYDAQMEIWLCSDRCLVNSFMPQLGDKFVNRILQDPEYNVVDFNKKAGVA